MITKVLTSKPVISGIIIELNLEEMLAIKNDYPSYTYANPGLQPIAKAVLKALNGD